MVGPTQTSTDRFIDTRVWERYSLSEFPVLQWFGCRLCLLWDHTRKCSHSRNLWSVTFFWGNLIDSLSWLLVVPIYIIILPPTLTCTHICTLMQMEILLSSELCAEEQEWAERLEKEEEEETLRTSPSARRREPRDLETKMQKGQNQHVLHWLCMLLPLPTDCVVYVLTGRNT